MMQRVSSFTQLVARTRHSTLPPIHRLYVKTHKVNFRQLGWQYFSTNLLSLCDLTTINLLSLEVRQQQRSKSTHSAPVVFMVSSVQPVVQLDRAVQSPIKLHQHVDRQAARCSTHKCVKNVKRAQHGLSPLARPCISTHDPSTH
jgi:hypothetical protein